jgi:hypothetical protein
MNTTTAGSWGPESIQPHMSAEQRQSAVVDRREFIVGEVSDSSIYTVALYMSSHVGRCARFARKLTGSSSPAAMPDCGGRAAVCWHSSASIHSREVLYSFVVSYWS